MRIISLVPSWTETLVQAGVNVVGRTRYCIHPSDQVKSIPVVGGTKSVDWKIIEGLKPDLLILDQEENPKEFAEQKEFPWLATHVTDIKSMADGFQILGKAIKNNKLSEFANRASIIVKNPPKSAGLKPPGAADLIGTIDPNKEFAYVIWKDPWMIATCSTFIGSVTHACSIPLGGVEGLGGLEKYPKVTTEELLRYNCLFSSEPFPFHKKIEDLKALGLNGWIVDGELYSWFGIRTLSFLESL